MNMREKGLQKKLFVAIAAVAVVAVVALALILAPGRKEESYRSIKIIELDGGVTIEREGVGVLEASSNMNLISGDEVKTGQDAYAVLQLDSDKYVMLAESGSMTVVAEGDEASGRTAIQLDSGSVLNEIQNPLSDGSSYDIVTPNATMSVRGTVFEVRKNGDGNTGDIEVLVYDGKVAVGLDGMESSLYGAGEYTQFTAGQDPQFIVERTEIAEENLNPQFMERLEQIDSQSRELNLGTAQLASAQTRDEAAEPKQTPAVSEPSAAPSQTMPVQTAVPVQTVTPKPEATPALVQVPVSTPEPQTATAVSGATTPDVPVAEDPAVDEEEQDDDRDEEEDGEDRNEADPSGSTQQSGGNNGSTGNESNPGGSGSTGNESNPGGSGSTGNESNPGGSGSTGNESNPGGSGSTGNESNPGGSGSTGNESNPGGSGSTGNEGNPGGSGSTGNEGNPGGSGNTGDTGNEQGTGSGIIYDKQNFWQIYTITDYMQASPAAGTECTVIYYVPEIIEAADTDGARYSTLVQASPAYTSAQATVGDRLTRPEDPVKDGFTFEGWCLEDGTEWDFDTAVKADMCLYPLWSREADDKETYYVPVICRSKEQHCYYCNSVEKGSLLKEITLSEGGNPAFLGWVRFPEGTKWDLSQDVVLKAESLRAAWSE